MEILAIIASAVVNTIAIIITNSYFLGFKGTPTAIILTGLSLGLVNRIFHAWFESVEHKILFSIFFGFIYIGFYIFGIQMVFDKMPGVYTTDIMWRIGVAFILFIINIIANRVIDSWL